MHAVQYVYVEKIHHVHSDFISFNERMTLNSLVSLCAKKCSGLDLIGF
jgi:hypothetical protein